MYIPNTQKWTHYYQNVGKDGHNPYINNAHRGGKQTGGGSLSGSPQQFITPIGPPHKNDHNEKVMVNLVSPVQQSINQAKDEVKRNMQGIKRRKREKTVSLTRKRQRKQIKKGKKVSKKKTPKKTSSINGCRKIKNTLKNKPRKRKL